MFGIKLVGETMVQSLAGSGGGGHSQDQIDQLLAIGRLVNGLEDQGDGTYYDPRTEQYARLIFDANGIPSLDWIGRAPSTPQGPGPVHQSLQQINGHYVWINPVTQEMTDTGLTVANDGANLQLKELKNGQTVIFNPSTGETKSIGGGAGAYYGFNSPEEAIAFANATKNATPEQQAYLRNIAAYSNATGDSVAALQYQRELDDRQFAQDAALQQGQLDLGYAQLSSQERQQAAQIEAQLANAGLDAESARRQALASVIANRNNNATNVAQTSGQIAATAADFASNPRDAVADILYREAIGGATPYGGTDSAQFGDLQDALKAKFLELFGGVGADLEAARTQRDQPIPADFTTPIAVPQVNFSPQTYKAPQINIPKPAPAAAAPVSPAAVAPQAGAGTDPWAAFRGKSAAEIAQFNAAYNPQPAPKEFTAAEKHWINGVAIGKGEPEPYPGFAEGGTVTTGDPVAALRKRIAALMNVKIGAADYSKDADVNGDGIINSLDLMLAGRGVGGQLGGAPPPRDDTGLKIPVASTSSPLQTGSRAPEGAYGLLGKPLPARASTPIGAGYSGGFWDEHGNWIPPYTTPETHNGVPIIDNRIQLPQLRAGQIPDPTNGKGRGMSPDIPSNRMLNTPFGQMPGIGNAGNIPLPWTIWDKIGNNTVASSHAKAALGPRATPKPFAEGGTLNFDHIFDREGAGFSPSSSEGGTNLNIHERAVIVGESGQVYGTLGEKRPDGTVRAEQLVIKPLKSEVAKDKRLEEAGKAKIETQQATMSHFDQGGTATSMPDSFYAGLRNLLSGIDPQAVANPGQKLADPRLLGAGVYNRAYGRNPDQDLRGYIESAYSSLGISPETLQYTLRAGRPTGYTPMVRYV